MPRAIGKKRMVIGLLSANQNTAAGRTMVPDPPVLKPNQYLPTIKGMINKMQPSPRSPLVKRPANDNPR